MEDEDVLQLLTGDDEFDADIDEDAEEELLRDDGAFAVADVSYSKQKLETNESIDDEEDDDDRDNARRGRFKSERIMSLVSVPNRRQEIPDNLDSVKVNEKYNNKGSQQQRNNYNNRRHNNNSRNSHHNHNNSGNDSHNRHTNYHQNRGLLPLPPPMVGGQPSSQLQNTQQSQQQQPPIHMIGPNLYGQQPKQVNQMPVNTIHVNPHFRARTPNQFDLTPNIRPMDQQQYRPPEPQFRPPVSAGIQSRLPFQPQNVVNNSQQMRFNPQMNHQMRPQFMANNNTLFNEQTIPQMSPQLRPQQQQQPLLSQPMQHHIQMENQWRGGGNGQMYGQHNMNQPLIPQMPLNRPLIPNNPMMNTQQSQQNFVSNNNNHSFNTNYIPNQPIQPSHQMQNNYNPQHQQYPHMDNQRFPVQHNYNQIPTLNSQNSQTYHTPPNSQQMFNKPNNNNNMNQLRQISPQMRQNPNKRPSFQSQSSHNRPNKSFAGDQRPDSLKAAQMRTKRAKQLLSKKQQNVVKEVPIVTNIGQSVTNNRQNSVNKEIEAAVGVDEEYKKKMEEQKRLREEILRQKEERRKVMAAQRLGGAAAKPPQFVKPTISQTNIKLTASPVRSQPPQQQIATLLNRSPQLTKQVPLQPTNNMRRVVNKPALNRVIVNPNQKRSVIIKGLASTTSEMTILKLCKPIGAVESCKFVTIGGQRCGNVTFVRRQDAQAFQSKYEHSLIDLCVVQISII